MTKRRVFSAIAVLILMLSCVLPAFAADAPTVEAKSMILIERNSGDVLAEQSADDMVYPASMTKVMTCLLALENLRLSDSVTVSETALADLDESGSSADLLPGETLSVEQLLYCMMLSSANEACNVAAEAVSGNIDTFIALMNTRASQLGCTGTHFANTHGLHDEDHYTTARDLSKIASEALKNPEFRKIVSTAKYTVPATNLSGERHLSTTNRMIVKAENNPYYDSRVSGVKTGFTTPAGRCLIACAENGPLSLLSVICGCDTVILESGDLEFRSFPETEKLLDWAFSSFTYDVVLTTLYPIAEIPVSHAAGANYVSLAPKNELKSLLPIDYDSEKLTYQTTLISEGGVSAPITAGDVLGSVTVSYGGKELGSTDLIAIASIERATLWDYLSPAKSGAVGLLRTVLLIFAILLVAAIVYTVIARIRKKKNKARRSRR